MKKSSQESPSEPAAGPRKIRYAVVGLGHITQSAVLPGFGHAKNSELVALVSGDDRKLAKLKRKYKVPHVYHYDEFRDCLYNDEVDAVYIALPNDLHCDCCLQAAEAGKNILCEKPLALSVRDGELMMRVAERNGVKFMTAYRLHFEPANLATIELIRSGKIGEPRYFNSTFSYQVTKNNIRLKWERGGGPLYDLGIYCINAARYLFEAEPVEVFATLTRGDDPRFEEVEEAVTAVLRFPRGGLANFTASFGSAVTSRYELVGTKGKVVLDPAYEYATGLRQFVTIDEKIEEKNFPHTDQFGAEIEAFSQCILQDGVPEPSAQEGLADLRVIEAIFQSAETGRAVRLPPFHKERYPEPRQLIEKPPVREPELVNAGSPHTE